MWSALGTACRRLSSLPGAVGSGRAVRWTSPRAVQGCTPPTSAQVAPLSSVPPVSLDISGIYPPIVTPFDSQENIDWAQLQHNMNLWQQAGFAGYVVQGSNGEYTFLTVEERVEMVRKVRDMVPKDKLIIAGSGCEATRDTIEMTRRMAEAGADAVLVVTPCYYKNRMNNSALHDHFLKVADTSPVPVILYSVPGNTAIDLDPSVVLALAPHPNIIGLKDSGGDISKIANMVYQTAGEQFQILAGSASFLYPALSVGCVGGVCALANVLGKETVELHTLIKEGRADEACALQHRLVAPNQAVTKQFGVAGLKTAMEWFGYYGGRTRSPLLALTPQEIEALKLTFTSTGFMHE